MVVVWRNYLVFSRKNCYQYRFLPVPHPDASAPVVIKNRSPRDFLGLKKKIPEALKADIIKKGVHLRMGFHSEFAHRRVHFRVFSLRPSHTERAILRCLDSLCPSLSWPIQGRFQKNAPKSCSGLDGPIRIDSQIRANRLILANRFRVPELNPFFCESRFKGAKSCESQVQGDTRESLARYENRVSLRIDSRESILANRPDSRCESPGHLSRAAFFLSSFERQAEVRSGRTWRPTIAIGDAVSCDAPVAR